MQITRWLFTAMRSGVAEDGFGNGTIEADCA